MMAQRDQNTAEDVVRESLGLTADDLGMNPAEDSFAHDDELQEDTDESFEESHQVAETGVEDDLSDPTPTQEALEPKPQPQTTLPKTAEVRVDGKGNLVDRKTGQVIARAGAEARMYQKLHRTTQAYSGLQAQYADIETRLNKAVEIGTQMFDKLKTLQNERSEVAPQTYGLNNSEAIEALTFAKEAKVNPVGTIQKLLTRAAASGIDLSSIGLSGGNFDPKALLDLVRGEIDTRMNPLKERSQRETAKEQQEREATERAEATKTELNTFLSHNPEAREYLPAFQRVYEQPQFQHMSLSEVWARIQLNLMRRRQDQPSSQRPANQRRHKKPLPSGRRMPPGGGKPSELAPVSTSYEDIVRDLLPK